ncbi:MAG: hypothetical protein ACYCV5_13315, partial [Acidimicrobiales bacterium]
IPTPSTVQILDQRFEYAHAAWGTWPSAPRPRCQARDPGSDPKCHDRGKAGERLGRPRPVHKGHRPAACT